MLHHFSLERLIELMRADAASASLEEPPRHVVRRAVRLLRDRKSSQRSLRHIIAELLFDSAVRPLSAAGVRSFDAAGRQLVFAAGEYELDLRLRGTSEQLYELRGQLLGPCPGTGRVVVTNHAMQRAETALNELCEFELRGVPSGTYGLTVHLPETTIEVSELRVPG